DPCDPAPEWPLKGGRKWESPGTGEVGVLEVGQALQNSYEVVAFEEVATPAGVFEAFKIVSRYSTYWYSPRVNYIVRYLVTTPSSVMRDFELGVLDPRPRPPSETAPPRPPRAARGRPLPLRALAP